jgi:membrane protein DedA with SNARE-associated domain
VHLIQDIISSIGYPGLAFLMALDATILPVPSAAVMGFAGYLCFTGRYSLLLVTMFGAVGSTVGSVTMYAIARWGGRPFLDRFGRYLGLDEMRLASMDAWFRRHGDRAVFLSQLLPVFRDLIPFPAGMGRMKMTRFAAFSFLGSVPFCLVLALVGMLSGPAWEPTIEMLDEYDIYLVLAGVAVILAYYLVMRRRKVRGAVDE